MSETAKRGNRRQIFRLSVRCCAFVIAVVLGLAVLPWAWTTAVLPSLSPHVLIGAAIAGRAVGLTTLIDLPALG